MLRPSPFLEYVVDEYFRARRLRTEHPRVTRGESRSVAADVEDIFATEVANAFPSIDHIYVNQTLTSTAGRIDGRMKPDLVVCQGSSVRLLIDLKMDVGYKRQDFVVAAALRADEVRNLRGKTVSLWKKVDDSRKRLEYMVDPATIYAYVVVTDDNVSAFDYANIKQCVSELPEIRLFTLVTGTHVNLYKVSEEDAKATVLANACTSEFNELSALIAAAAA
jgi:hypothetical protein